MLFLLYIKLTPQSVTEHHTHTHVYIHTHTLARICNLMALDLSARSGSLPLILLSKHQRTRTHTHTHHKALTPSCWLNGRRGPTGLCWHNTRGELPPLNSILYPTGVWLLSRIPQPTHYSRLYIHPFSAKTWEGKRWCEFVLYTPKKKKNAW